jgi:RNA polymerase sigma-70 factor (ECF subfamily)
MVGDRCMGIAYGILRDGDLAEDAVQSALIKAWRELPTLRDPDRFQPWLHRILTNECYEQARSRRRQTAYVRALPTPGWGDRTAFLNVDDRDELERGLRRLTLEQRAVLVFYHYVGLSVADIAAHLGIPVGTVKSRLHHATSALRASLEADARTQTAQESLA